MLESRGTSLKILQLVQKPQRRGAEVFAHQLSCTLRGLGHEVSIVYLYPFADQGALSLHSDDRILDGCEAHRAEQALGIHPGLLRSLLQVIDDFQPDVIQVNGARTVKYGAMATWLRLRRSWVLIYRNIGNPQDWVHGWQRYLFYRRLVIPSLDGIVAVSQTTLENLFTFYQLLKPATYIPNGVSVPATYIPRGIDSTTFRATISQRQLRSELELPLNVPIALFVGSLTAEKRIDRLLRVFVKVRVQYPELRLWIVGDGPLRQLLEAETQAMALADYVHFWGIQAHVENFMNAADLFLLTSDTEGIPGVILEAGLMELPTVATRVGGVAECVREGETGLLVDPTDEAGFVNAVTTLLQNPDRRRYMGQQAKMWVTEHFAMDKIAQRYLLFYAEVLAQHKGRKAVNQG